MRQTEYHATDTGDEVKFGELCIVVDDSTWHTSEAREVLREECQVETDSGPPEENLPQSFVVHMASPFRQPVVDSSHNGEYRSRYQYIVEVGNNEVGVMVLEINWRHCQH